MRDDAWVRIYSEIYEDCIVGNKQGLLELRKSIDEALQDGNANPVFKSDISSVVCINESWEAEQNLEDESSVIGFALKIFLVLWVLILPIVGIIGLVKYFKI